MSEITSFKELEIKVNRTSLFGCYMTLLQDLLLPNEGLREDFTPPPIFKKLENTFASPEKFNELKESFRKIFSRTGGKNLISKKEKEVMIRWYGLEDERPYYENGSIIEGTERIAEELNLTRQEVSEMKQTGFLKLREKENFNLLPQEANDLICLMS